MNENQRVSAADYTDPALALNHSSDEQGGRVARVVSAIAGALEQHHAHTMRHTALPSGTTVVSVSLRHLTGRHCDEVLEAIGLLASHAVITGETAVRLALRHAAERDRIDHPHHRGA